MLLYAGLSVENGALAFFGVVLIIISIQSFVHDGYVKNRNKDSRKKYAFIAEETIFNNTLLILIASVIKVDGYQKDPEIKYVKKALSLHFHERKVDRVMELLQKYCKYERFKYLDIARVVNLNFTFGEKIQLLHFLIGIVTADGVLTKAEDKIILEIARAIRIPVPSLRGIYNMFSFITEEELNNRKKRNEEKKTIHKSSSKLKRSLEILGLMESATVKQIKKAYRKSVLTHHPDRLIHLGEEHKKSAESKFLAISEAYEYIKEYKGFS